VGRTFCLCFAPPPSPTCAVLAVFLSPRGPSLSTLSPPSPAQRRPSSPDRSWDAVRRSRSPPVHAPVDRRILELVSRYFHPSMLAPSNHLSTRSAGSGRCSPPRAPSRKRRASGLSFVHPRSDPPLSPLCVRVGEPRPPLLRRLPCLVRSDVRPSFRKIFLQTVLTRCTPCSSHSFSSALAVAVGHAVSLLLLKTHRHSCSPSAGRGGLARLLRRWATRTEAGTARGTDDWSSCRRSARPTPPISRTHSGR